MTLEQYGIVALFFQEKKQNFQEKIAIVEAIDIDLSREVKEIVKAFGVRYFQDCTVEASEYNYEHKLLYVLPKVSYISLQSEELCALILPKLKNVLTKDAKCSFVFGGWHTKTELCSTYF